MVKICPDKSDSLDKIKMVGIRGPFNLQVKYLHCTYTALLQAIHQIFRQISTHEEGEHAIIGDIQTFALNKVVNLDVN